MSVLNLRRLEETTLLKHLETGYTAEDAKVASVLAANLPAICDEAYQRMKAFPSLHPEYTLHDEAHLLRVTELMAMVLGDGLASLNPVEVALLILAAHFHDQGMVLDSNEITSLTKDQKYLLFYQSWIIEHPTLSEVQDALNQNNHDTIDLETLRQTEQQLLEALHTDYIRTTHGERSAKFILANYGVDPRWQVSGVNIADYVARLSKSHVRPASDLNEGNNFNYDEAIGTYKVNMVFLGVILRLADILDFDRDRTPDSLYRSIHFTSPVSLLEWEKHRTITGWTIDPAMVRFTAYCEHPEYERAVRQFMNWIDIELSTCHILVNKFPKPFEHYRLNLPLITNKERIGPKNGAYIYHDLEFSLSRDQIVKLLMTDQLYGSANLCVRELLQNALDALRLRRAVFLRDSGAVWSAGKVEFEHELDENGYEIVRCIDNGVGMDETIITKFLTSVGRSYYRSPEFEQERHSLREAKADFEPIGQFGIGFMSCFMLGDRIRIYTKKDYGQGGGQGRNLMVEINGLGGIVTIKEIDRNLPIGTTVEIQCGRFEGILNYFNTKAQVVGTISEIAIAPEFPVTATCTIPENIRHVDIPETIYSLLTPQEKNDFVGIATASFNFTELDPRLQGVIKHSFITTDDSSASSVEISLSNSEASLIPADRTKLPDGTIKRQDAGWIIHKPQTGSRRTDSIARVAFDGIYVCGNARYNGDEDESYRWSTSITHFGNMMDNGNSTFTLNVRGLLKAPLTPARTPMLSNYNRHLLPEWQRLADYVSIGQARIYENLIAQRLGVASPETYWRLIVFNRFDLSYLRMGEAWQYISIPCTDAEDKVTYIPLSELGPLTTFNPTGKYREYSLYTEHGLACNMFDRELWQSQKSGGRTHFITDLLMSFSTVSIIDKKYIITPTTPTNPNQLVGSKTMKFSYDDLYLLPYLFQLNDILLFVTYNITNTANINHPVVKMAMGASGKTIISPIEKLCRELLKLHRALEEPLVEAVNGTAKPEALTNRLGLFYTMVNWSLCSPDLKPPYKILFPSGNVVELTDEVLTKWSKNPFTCS